MPEDHPQELKAVLPFLQRAQEVNEKEPLIAYYLKYFALQQAIPVALPDSKWFLFKLMDELELEKGKIGEDELVDDKAYTFIEAFGMRVFTRADESDRSGEISKAVAKTFMAAAQFFEILSVFGDQDPSVLEKIKYAKFKAVEIMKAVKEGRAQASSPTPPTDTTTTPTGTLSTPTAPTEDTLDTYSEPSFPHIPIVIEIGVKSPLALQHSSTSIHSDRVHSPTPKQTLIVEEGEDVEDAFAVDYTILNSAEKHARYTSTMIYDCSFAVSALQYEDIDTAIQNLEKALTLLRSQQNSH